MFDIFVFFKYFFSIGGIFKIFDSVRHLPPQSETVPYIFGEY